jgi:hypothetical protein
MPISIKLPKVVGGGTPPPPPEPSDFPNKRSSGPFTAPKDATFLDWAVLNGGGYPHWIRVTVHKCPIGAAKIIIAGPTSVYLNSKFTAHLTVPLNGASCGDYYEVFCEDEDLAMHPSVQLFRVYPQDLITGSLIPTGDFVQTQT